MLIDLFHAKMALHASKIQSLIKIITKLPCSYSWLPDRHVAVDRLCNVPIKRTPNRVNKGIALSQAPEFAVNFSDAHLLI